MTNWRLSTSKTNYLPAYMVLTDIYMVPLWSKYNRRLLLDIAVVIKRWSSTKMLLPSRIFMFMLVIIVLEFSTSATFLLIVFYAFEGDLHIDVVLNIYQSINQSINESKSKYIWFWCVFCFCLIEEKYEESLYLIVLSING